MKNKELKDLIQDKSIETQSQEGIVDLNKELMQSVTGGTRDSLDAVDDINNGCTVINNGCTRDLAQD